MRGERFFLAGGAGFIGSHFTDRLLADGAVRRVTLYDNFSSGREWHYAHHSGDDRLRVVRGDVKDLSALRAAMDGHDLVIHLASNPDIARAATGGFNRHRWPPWANTSPLPRAYLFTS